MRQTDIDQFEFDNYGSSHSHRDNPMIDDKIQIDHLNHKTSFTHLDTTVVILPCDSHRLDYFNNQFSKQQQSQLLQYLDLVIGKGQVECKLRQGWNYDNTVDKLTPVWILREFISLWITDCFNNAYVVEKYQQVPHNISITTQDIFLDLLNTIFKICNAVKLTVEVDDAIILKNHLKFLNAQQYHESQIRCEQWCHNVIQGTSALNPCKTIFDEAYVQYFLRKQGFEIQCNGLNVLPAISTTLTEIIYKA